MIGLPNLASYMKRITSQYQLSDKMLNWLGVVLTPIDDAQQLLSVFDDSFLLQEAIGAQLDILGSIVGANRTVSFQPRFGVSPILDDTTYRVLIAATIARNHWNGQIDSIYPVWSQLFPGGQIIIFDNQDMSMTVVMSGAFTTILQDLITNDYIVPRPQGVLINYTFSSLPIFGCDANDDFISGFDGGHWS